MTPKELTQKTVKDIEKRRIKREKDYMEYQSFKSKNTNKKRVRGEL